MAYRDKYLKYKKKYLELTSELRGGITQQMYKMKKNF